MECMRKSLVPCHVDLLHDLSSFSLILTNTHLFSCCCKLQTDNVSDMLGIDSNSHRSKHTMTCLRSQHCVHCLTLPVTCDAHIR